MNLVDTPKFVNRQFKEIGINLAIISEESVLAYYIKFHDEICNHHKLPCHVSETKFTNVEYFISFVKFLSKHNLKQDHIKAEDDITEEKIVLVANDDINRDLEIIYKMLDF